MLNNGVVGDFCGEAQTALGANHQMQDNIDLLQTYLGQGLAPLEGRQTRIYATNGVAPHIVGYTGFIPAEQIDAYLAEGYRGDEKVGLSGLEQSIWWPVG